MEAEIVEFSKRDLDIQLIRRWWRSNPAFSTIEEDNVFEDLLENHFVSFISFMAFMWENGENPKDVAVFAINKGFINELCKPEVSFEGIENIEKIVDAFLISIKNDLEKEQIINDTNIRDRLNEAFKVLFGI